MVSSANPLASLAGVDVLRAGGNAMDAAIATMAVLGVVESLNLGLGGDCFALYAPRGTDRIIAYNGSGRAPAAAHAEWYRSRGFTEIPAAGPHGVTIPGAVEAWARLAADHGTRGLDELLRHAIHYAEEGYPVHDVIANWWPADVEKLRADPEAARVLLWDGQPPAAGTIHRQPDLAQTLRRVGRESSAGFYDGPVAEAMVQHLRAKGGLHTLEDFASHQGEYVTPISLDYRGYRLHECPPNGQGIAALIMLGILQEFDLPALDPRGADRFHLAIEAGRLAIRDRDRLVGDPETAGDWRKLLEPAYLSSQRAKIDLARAAPPVPPASLPMGRDTCHVAVIDRDCNAVSLIASVFYNFGSGLVAPGTGVVLQNRGCGFVLTPHHPNEIGPRKRPLHTIIPALVSHAGRISHSLGVVGGHYQAWGHTQVVTNLVDYGYDVQEAIDAPRVFHNGANVELEPGLGPEVRTELTRRQHRVVDVSETSMGRLGGGQLIAIDWEKGTLAGAADRRLDGCALGY
jgi:gamma-glutamyltranspeptidase/glutathione hydrolase